MRVLVGDVYDGDVAVEVVDGLCLVDDLLGGRLVGVAVGVGLGVGRGRDRGEVAFGEDFVGVG